MNDAHYENKQDRNDYSVGASQSTQDNFERVAGQLEAALDRRDKDVKAAMAEYQADGVSDEYAAMEQQWNTAGASVRNVIKSIRTSLAENDDVALATLKKAKSYLPGG